MRSILKSTSLVLVLLALVVPLAAYAADGPCPDDPVASQDCYTEYPPYFVVVNRDEEHLADRSGTGCQPFILNHPDCEDCTDPADPACSAIDVDAEVCQAVMAPRGYPAGDLYELCCDCAENPDGDWVYRLRRFDGTFCSPVGEWNEGLPPGTGIELPTPIIVGGLAVIGAGLLAVGILLRRRTVAAR